MFCHNLCIPAMAVLAFALCSSSIHAEPQIVERKKTSKRDRKKTEKYVISLTPPTFIPATNPANASDATGSKLIFNGEVKEIETEETIGTFNQLCTATKIVADFSVPSAEIQETICDYNFCLDEEKGCLFLRSGGPFLFDPFSTEPGDVPDAVASIVGGTGDLTRYIGGAKIVTTERTIGGSSDGVYEFTLFYKRKKRKDSVKFE